jgi:ATP-binding cassette subfamily B protein
MTVNMTVLPSSRSVSRIVSNGLLIYYTNVQLFLVVFPSLVVTAAIKIKFIKVAQVLWTKSHRRNESIVGHMGEIFDVAAFKTVRSFAREHHEYLRYRTEMRWQHQSLAEASLIDTVGWPFIELIGRYGELVGLWFGARLVMRGAMNSPELITLIGVISDVSWTVFNLLNLGQEVGKIAEPAANLADLLSTESKIETAPWCQRRTVSDSLVYRGPTGDVADLISEGEIRGDFSFRGVTFCYPSRPDAPVLRGLSFDVAAGEQIALVGHTGCGKSTCIGLLERFYDFGGGAIELDGRSIRDFECNFLRSHIGFVGQEPVLFAMTIKENLQYGTIQDKTDEELEAACKHANAWEFIRKMPEGLGTEVGERGAQLSGGQKQRIAIARALLKAPSILLLDEATSALDNKSEAVVQDALNYLMRGRTSFTIAHRLSTVRNADQILVLEEGRVAESGTHGELMRRRRVNPRSGEEEEGLYAQFVRTAQSAGDDDA